MGNKNHRTGLNRSSSRPKKKLLWVLFVLLVITGVFVVLEKTGVTNFIKLHHPITNPTAGPTAEQKKEEDAANAESKKQVIDNDKAGTDTPTPSNVKATKSVDLSAQQATNNTVTVFTTLRGYSDGSCFLTVTNADKTSTQSAPVIYQREASSCAGFSVPIEPLGKGMWTLKLDVTSGGATNSKTIPYEVK
jgi:cytoskeletal protein RodZ